MRRLSDSYAMITARNALSPVTESFRALCTNLQFIQGDSGVWTPHVIAVTSAYPGEGKTITAVNLAVAYAQEGKRVLLIEGDIRKQSFMGIFGHEGGSGLVQAIHADEAPADAAYASAIENLFVIPAGYMPGIPSADLFASKRFEGFVQMAREQYDIVIMDTPPVLVVNDAKQIALRCDGVLLVAQSGRTRRKWLQQAQFQLERVNANLLGTVLNRYKGRQEAGLQAYSGMKR
ncbi:CpsD/CapB family tyrosine-protein kinase [Paenibacillus alvei]|uniref:non-specific protein-tyrosine kinase n=1 Tax=Paenibacillus alvei TaxID=44250 RepID=A0AAP7DH76_PAEAL|nr:CpsD/CapB family tyrosine-protein kinase [Paenibacillus alvei]NOJ69324.1 CpsD/CapB family tyrosine-protein kinase [Paenibacillus alvei]